MHVVGLDIADDGSDIDTRGTPGLVLGRHAAAPVERRIVEVGLDRLQQLRLADPAGEGLEVRVVGRDRGRCQAARLGLGAPVRQHEVGMPPAEGTRVELEGFDGVVAQEAEHPHAEPAARLRGAMADPLRFDGVRPVVPAQDQRQHMHAALRLQRQGVELDRGWIGTGHGTSE